MRIPAALALVLAVTACGADKTAGRPDGQRAAARAAPAGPAAPAPSGQAVFARTCQTCHQATGRGMPGAFPPLAGSPIATGEQGKLIRLVLHGLQGPVVVNGQRFNNVMPPWKAQLSDAELAAVLTFVRSSWGNRAAAVSAEDVARGRAATAGRNAMWTIEELERSR